MFGVGRDLCGSSSPTPLPKQGHLQQAAQDRVQAGLEYLQRLPSLFDCVLEVSQAMWLNIYRTCILLSSPHGNSGLGLVRIFKLQMFMCVAISLCEVSTLLMLTLVLTLCKEADELCGGDQVQEGAKST